MKNHVTIDVELPRGYRVRLDVSTGTPLETRTWLAHESDGYSAWVVVEATWGGIYVNGRPGWPGKIPVRVVDMVKALASATPSLHGGES